MNEFSAIRIVSLEFRFSPENYQTPVFKKGEAAILKTRVRLSLSGTSRATRSMKATRRVLSPLTPATERPILMILKSLA